MLYRPNSLILAVCSFCLSFSLQAAPDYEPPETGSPTHRTGAGTRSDVSSKLHLRLLANPQQQNVISAQPILFWEVSQALTKPAQFLLQKVESGESVLELSLPVSKAGLQMLDLSHYNAVLETDSLYEWAITIPPQGDLGSPLIMGATIQRQTSDEKLQQALLATDDKASVYSQANLWYEALAHSPDAKSKTVLLKAANLSN